MKSIKIKLKHQNQSKLNKLQSTLSTLQELTPIYLKDKLTQLETKSFKSAKSKETYKKYRDLYPNINSGILQAYLIKLDQTVKSYIAWCKKKHKLVEFPKNIKTFIPLRNDLFHFEFNKTSKSFNAWLKLLRTYFPLKLCKYHLKALADFESISDSSIIVYKNELYLRLVFNTKEKQLKTNSTLGIDIGIVKPIVCSDGKQFGSGRYIKHKKIEFGKKRARNQKLKLEISTKQSNWANDLNHKLSRELIDYCLQQGIDVLGFEALKGGHLANKRFRRYSWAFKDLLSKVAYKALDAGLKVVEVDPKYTSQRCHKCGSISKKNRQTQDRFHCSKCSYIANADLNAAKNIQYLSVLNGLNVNLGNGSFKPEASVL
jgi:IS605 OrfB family transposase